MLKHELSRLGPHPVVFLRTVLHIYVGGVMINGWKPTVQPVSVSYQELRVVLWPKLHTWSYPVLVAFCVVTAVNYISPWAAEIAMRPYARISWWVWLRGVDLILFLCLGFTFFTGWCKWTFCLFQNLIQLRISPVHRATAVENKHV